MVFSSSLNFLNFRAGSGGLAGSGIRAAGSGGRLAEEKAAIGQDGFPSLSRAPPRAASKGWNDGRIAVRALRR